MQVSYQLLCSYDLQTVLLILYECWWGKLHVSLMKKHISVIMLKLDSTKVQTLCAISESINETRHCTAASYIRASVDALCRDGASEISRDPRTKRR